MPASLQERSLVRTCVQQGPSPLFLVGACLWDLCLLGGADRLYTKSEIKPDPLRIREPW